jgi:hypothetical protein
MQQPFYTTKTLGRHQPSIALCCGPVGGNCESLCLKRNSRGSARGGNHASTRESELGQRRKNSRRAQLVCFTPGSLLYSRRCAWAAQGQEWKSVYLLNVVDGCMPSDLGAGTSAELEEERRLLYVAMTRAKDDLHLMAPQRFFTHGQPSQGDRHVYASRTRFIPEELLGLPSARIGRSSCWGTQIRGHESTSGRAYAECGARPRDALPARENYSHREVESLLCEITGNEGRVQGITRWENAMLRTIERRPLSGRSTAGQSRY